MELIRGLKNLKTGQKGCVATIGNFDGIHLGHQALLAKLLEKGRSLQLPAVVITFEPQPLEFFAPEKKVPRITRFREKWLALSKTGVSRVLVLRFNATLALMSAEAFIQQVLVDGLGIKAILVGDDFKFGFERRGDFALLQQTGKRLGFEVANMPSVMLDGERISSTRVRQALAQGDQKRANALLGHSFRLSGRVMQGDKRGRLLGFPTANISLQRKAVPVQGVYAVRVLGIEKKSVLGVANIGTRPTVDGTRTVLEVHLFDFNREIYGQPVCVEFLEKLRDEKRFENLDLLKEQIAKDCDAAKAYFKRCGEC